MLGSVIISIGVGFASGALGWILGGPLLGLLAYAVGGALALLDMAALRFAASRRPERPFAPEEAAGAPALGRSLP